MEVITTPTHWDCECKENYIHPKTLDYCPKCDVFQDDQPDSILSEVQKATYINTCHMTFEQKESLVRKWAQDNNGMTLEEFVDTAQPTVGMDNAIVVKWCGMWLVIEADGYCHS